MGQRAFVKWGPLPKVVGVAAGEKHAGRTMLVNIPSPQSVPGAAPSTIRDVIPFAPQEGGAVIFIAQAQGIGEGPQHHPAAHGPTLFPSAWQSGENAGPVPGEAVRSLALPNGSVPFGNTQNLPGTIYL